MKVLFIFIILNSIASCSLKSERAEHTKITQHIDIQEDGLKVLVEIEQSDHNQTRKFRVCSSNVKFFDGKSRVLLHDQDQTTFYSKDYSKLEFFQKFKTEGQGIKKVSFEDSIAVYTQLQPTSLCQLLPVSEDDKENENERILFNLSIDLPENWILAGFSDAKKGTCVKSKCKWSMTSSGAIPALSFSFFAGTFDVVTAEDIPSHLYILKGHSSRDLGKVLARFNSIQKNVRDYFKLWHLPVYDLMLIPHFEPGAMENFRMITITEDLVLSSKQDLVPVANFVMLHENVHQLLGNCLSNASLRQLFFVEGITQYIAEEIAKTAPDKFVNPFKREFSEGHIVNVNKDAVEVYFTKKSYALGSKIIRGITEKNPTFNIQNELMNYYQSKGCGDFDFTNLNSELKNSIYK